ncbi:MAG: nitroreductase family deazaflavin-dependent oxidoreductase [Acidimicrobiaceae bacterium]|nr:nitroreductase family deazaflavin-dependent oxidoreductase [Acidimicrobiaceae bacterium]MDE0666193.1 nitroreductase family deazaflavin-dependent oxidoreductase [Acidimicrobiaceae bacterium]
MGSGTGESDPGQPPAPPKGFRGSGRLLVSRPFRVIGPHVFPPLHRAINRLTGGRTLLDTSAQPMLMLTTKGAKTGRLRETPLGAVPLEAGRLLLVGSNFAREHHPAWTANLIANPDAEIMFRGRRTRVRARLLEGAEREQRWQTAVTWFPVWTRYVTVTDREFRLFELDPVADAD